jgi:hypothetical protein
MNEIRQQRIVKVTIVDEWNSYFVKGLFNGIEHSPFEEDGFYDDFPCIVTDNGITSEEVLDYYNDRQCWKERVADVVKFGSMLDEAVEEVMRGACEHVVLSVDGWDGIKIDAVDSVPFSREMVDRIKKATGGRMLNVNYTIKED